jgi:hypothetical protein
MLLVIYTVLVSVVPPGAVLLATYVSLHILHSVQHKMVMS